jgi:hypothetical protein
LNDKTATADLTDRRRIKIGNEKCPKNIPQSTDRTEINSDNYNRNFRGTTISNSNS